MEPYLGLLADMYRRDMIARTEQGRRADDPFRGALRARAMWWIAVARLRRAVGATARSA
jgi:hypothetical protein